MLVMNVQAVFLLVALSLLTTGCPERICKNSSTLMGRITCENLELPQMAEPRDFPAPLNPGDYQVCPESIDELSDQEIFTCAQEDFWHALSDGRLEVREEAEQLLGRAIDLTEISDDYVQRSILYNFRGDLRMAMSLENGQSKFALFAESTINADLRKSLELNPGYVPSQAFLDSMEIVMLMIKNQWQDATDRATATLDRIEELSDSDDLSAGAFSVSGTFLGFPLATGIPQRTAKLMRDSGCPESLHWCDNNTEKAPFCNARIGFS